MIKIIIWIEIQYLQERRIYKKRFGKVLFHVHFQCLLLLRAL